MHDELILYSLASSYLANMLYFNKGVKLVDYASTSIENSTAALLRHVWTIHTLEQNTCLLEKLGKWADGRSGINDTELQVMSDTVAELKSHNGVLSQLDDLEYGGTKSCAEYAAFDPNQM